MSEKEKSPTAVEEPDMTGTYTAADYLQWQLEEMVELIRGKLFKMTPAPSSNHQRISVELTRIFANHFRKLKCEVFEAPFDVFFVKKGQSHKQTRNIVEPDLCVICDPEKIKKFGCVGAPDLIIEILSPSTSQKDQKDKFELYEEYGVKEYWIVSPENRSVLVNVLENGKYKTLRPRTEAETLHSIIFPELNVELEDVFKNVSID